MERHNQVAGLVYRNICSMHGCKILGYFQIQSVVANQPYIVIANKLDKKAAVVVVAFPSDSNIRKKENKKFENYQGLKQELERMWGVKASVVPEVICALGAVSP